MTSAKAKHWVLVVDAADGPPFLLALLGACVKGLRVVQFNESWYFRLPSVQKTWACWHGFLAGRNAGHKRKRMGYTMGPPTLVWPPRGQGVVVFPTNTKHETP